VNLLYKPKSRSRQSGFVRTRESALQAKEQIAVERLRSDA
jgi:hypothetical protein